MNNHRKEIPMLFVSMMTFVAPGVSPRDIIARRAQWKHPEGVKPIAEYWLQGKPDVICVFEADNIAPIMAATVAWGDVASITVLPAITAEEGLKLASQMTA